MNSCKLSFRTFIFFLFSFFISLAYLMAISCSPVQAQDQAKIDLIQSKITILDQIIANIKKSISKDFEITTPNKKSTLMIQNHFEENQCILNSSYSLFEEVNSVPDQLILVKHRVFKFAEFLKKLKIERDNDSLLKNIIIFNGQKLFYPNNFTTNQMKQASKDLFNLVSSCNLKVFLLRLQNEIAETMQVSIHANANANAKSDCHHQEQKQEQGQEQEDEKALNDFVLFLKKVIIHSEFSTLTVIPNEKSSDLFVDINLNY